MHRVVSLLKRCLLGTHQGAVSRVHLDYYLDEFTFRFNRKGEREMTRYIRNMSFAVFVLTAILTRTSPVLADSCEEVFYTSCQVELQGSQYFYLCVSGEECGFFHGCCQQYCGGSNVSDCIDAGSLKIGSCGCGG